MTSNCIMDHTDNCFEFKFPLLMATIAKRESGKSFMTKYLVHHWINNKYIDDVVVFTQTNEANHEYHWVKPKRVIKGYDEKIMTGIMNKQIEQIKKKPKKVKNVLIVLDDMVGSLDAYSPIVRRLITTGRHYKISLILNIQIGKREFSTDFRTNADYFLVGYNGKQTFKHLFDEFEFNGNLAEFLTFMHKNTTSFNFVLYINKVMNTYDIDRRYKIIKAEESDELEHFKIK